MNFPRKLLSILKEILILPLKAVITATGGFGFIALGCIIYMGDATYTVLAVIPAIFFSILAYSVSILLFDILNAFKETEVDPMPIGDGEKYSYEETVKHDICYEDGTVIGYYTTTETKEGYEMSRDEFVGIIK